MGRRIVCVCGLAAFAMLTCAAPAAARLAMPDSVAFMSDKGEGCGIRADYDFNGATLRVEVLAFRDAGGASIATRVYSPSSVSPMMRDVWLKTKSLFTVGQFKPARENGNGILESRGDVETKMAEAVVAELAVEGAEISIIFEGVMPMARVPVGLPGPLPETARMALEDCAAKLFAR